MKNFKHYLLLLLGLILSYTEYSSAECIQNPNFNNILSYLPKKNYQLQFDDTSSHQLDVINIPYGSSMYTTTTSNPTCNNPNLIALYDPLWGTGDNITLLPTNVPGISINVKTTGIGDSYLSKRIGGVDTPPDNVYYLPSPSWTIEIWKTGTVPASGSLRSGSLATLRQVNTPPLVTWNLSRLEILPNSVNFNVGSCSLKFNVPTVQLGDWYDTQFPTVGSTSTEVDIPITLNCMAGTNIKATVTATSGTVYAAQGQLALSGTNKATGVAIQIIDANKNPIPLNSKETIKDNAAAGNYIFGWKARYIKTADKITPGPANGTATINIRYE